jgi:hypothetical protein
VKKLLLLLIIPFLSFGQCEDESACNYGMTAEDFIDGAFTDDCEYVGDYCFLDTLFGVGGEDYINISLVTGDFYSWNNDCECVDMSGDCKESENNCEVVSNSFRIPSPAPENIIPSPGPFLVEPNSLACFAPGDSCLYPTMGPFGSMMLPINILDELQNYPFDWLTVNHFNSVFNDDCECQCVPGEYFAYVLNIDDDTISIKGFYNDCISGFVNTSIYELPESRSWLKTVDILGKETNNKGFQLHIYDDGSVEKKYLIK